MHPSLTKCLLLTTARLKDHGLLWRTYHPALFSNLPFSLSFHFFLFPFPFPFPFSFSFSRTAKQPLFVSWMSQWPQYALWDSSICSCSSILPPLRWSTDISGPLRPQSALLGYSAWHHAPLGRLAWRRVLGSSAKEDYLTVYILSYQKPGAVSSTEISVSLRLSPSSHNRVTKISLYTI